MIKIHKETKPTEITKKTIEIIPSTENIKSKKYIQHKLEEPTSKKIIESSSDESSCSSSSESEDDGDLLEIKTFLDDIQNLAKNGDHEIAKILLDTICDKAKKYKLGGRITTIKNIIKSKK